MTGFNIREAMADGSARYPMTGLMEMGDGFFGGKHQATRGRGAERKGKEHWGTENGGVFIHHDRHHYWIKSAIFFK